MVRWVMATVVLAAATTVLAEEATLQEPKWAYAVSTVAVAPLPPDTGKVYTLAGAPRGFTLSDFRDPFTPPDWFPNEHPVMPPIVQQGDRARGMLACSLCHYPNGKGRPENASLAGLPQAYLIQQLNDMRAGLRHSAEPLKGNAQDMVKIAQAMTDQEIEETAAYFASLPSTPWIRVVESPTAPKARSIAGLIVPLEGAEAGAEPIGGRIVEVPEDTFATSPLHDPHSGFVAYVPPGSIARGRALAETGGGRTLPCAGCHGAGLRGTEVAPSLAGRSPSYAARQLNDFRKGARKGPTAVLMAPVTARLTTEDITDLTAYLASLKPAASGS